MASIGVDFKLKNLTLDGKKVKLQIWDTAGQETYRALARSFYRNANVVILMYDLTRRESFQNLDEWIREARQNAGSDTLMYLVGNMLDIAEEREVLENEALEYVKQEHLDGFTEASAKTAQNVEDVFIKVTNVLLSKEVETPVLPSPRIQIKEQEPKKKKKCC